MKNLVHGSLAHSIILVWEQWGGTGAVYYPGSLSLIAPVLWDCLTLVCCSHYTCTCSYALVHLVKSVVSSGNTELEGKHCLCIFKSVLYL